MQYSSRLSRRYEKSSKRQSYLLLLGSLGLLIIFIVFGFPAILNLTGQIGRLGKEKTPPFVEKGLTPASPRLSQDFDATNSATIKLAGVADPKITIQLVQNDQAPVTAVSGDDGVFNFTVSLTKGENSFTFQGISETGVKSEPSRTYKITYLVTPPKLEINSPKDNETVKESQLSISGKSDPGVGVTINGRLAFVFDDGSFSGTITLSGGENRIKIIATDKAGNQTTRELTISRATP